MKSSDQNLDKPHCDECGKRIRGTVYIIGEEWLCNRCKNKRSSF